MAAETVAPASPTQRSITGALGSILDNVLPTARDILVAKYQADNAPNQTGAGNGTVKAGQTGDWRDTVATQPAGITKQPWFLPAVIGGGVLLVLGLVAVLFMGGRRRD